MKCNLAILFFIIIIIFLYNNIYLLYKWLKKKH